MYSGYRYGTTKIKGKNEVPICKVPIPGAYDMLLEVPCLLSTIILNERKAQLVDLQTRNEVNSANWAPQTQQFCDINFVVEAFLIFVSVSGLACFFYLFCHSN